MGKILTYILVGFAVSFYFFPITFTFLPGGLNTKMILALIGIYLQGMNWLGTKKIDISRGLLFSVVIALVFSFICYLSTDLNHTNDYAYASYIVSFAVWFFGAYSICYLIRQVHGIANFRILTYYLAAVCFSQCVLALIIDNVEPAKVVVNRYVNQGQDFFEEVDRLYGVGAALDPAGVRFSIELVMIAAVLSNDAKTRKNSLSITFLLISFFTIGIIGNAISRTTIIGVLAGMAYFLIGSGLFHYLIKMESVKLGVLFGFILIIAIAVSTYLYQTNQDFYDHMRFAFEGFFNWIEKGEWRTGSTDKLNREMWIWPTDQKTWLIGSGLFDNYVYSTDIGYCRFILYCGLIGFSVFSFLFVFNALLFMKRQPKYKIMFFIFFVLTFVFWVKVATDIFFIYALFYCLDTFEDTEVDELAITNYEVSLLHPRYV